MFVTYIPGKNKIKQNKKTKQKKNVRKKTIKQMFGHLDTFLEVCQNENCFSIRSYFHQRHLSLLKKINYFLTKTDLIFSTSEEIFNSHLKMGHYFLNSQMHHGILKSIWSSIEKLL